LNQRSGKTKQEQLKKDRRQQQQQQHNAPEKPNRKIAQN